MADFITFVDRVEIYIDNEPYLTEGYIQNFRASLRTTSQIIRSMTPNGINLGGTQGNGTIDVMWEEILPPTNKYINFYTALLPNPDAVITVVPYTIASGNSVQTYDSLAITGILVTNGDIDFGGEGTQGNRRVTFVATTCSGLNA